MPLRGRVRSYDLLKVLGEIEIAELFIGRACDMRLLFQGFIQVVHL